jgi:glycosyltransferase involved in cell wall biosynthesis
LYVGSWARKRHQYFESQVLASADEIITITPFYVKKFEQLSKRNVRLLTNGFDEDDFKGIEYSQTEKFIIRHVGIVNEKCNPVPFLEVVSELIHESVDFAGKVQIEFIGEVHEHLSTVVENSPVLRSLVRFYGNIPHQQLMKLYGSSSLLLLILTGYKDAEGYMPGKLFEYIATGLPVLGVGPVNGDAAYLLKESGAGIMVDSFDRTAIKNHLQRYFQEWHSRGEPTVKGFPAKNYSRRGITEKLSELLG